VRTGIDFDSIQWRGVRRLTFVPFLDDGSCALVPERDRLVAPGGRPLASSYVLWRDRSRHADQVLRRLGFRVDGITGHAGGGVPPTAWIQRP
jgi:hypothetical protein